MLDIHGRKNKMKKRKEGKKKKKRMLKIQKLEMEIHFVTLKVLLVPATMEHRDQNYPPS